MLMIGSAGVEVVPWSAREVRNRVPPDQDMILTRGIEGIMYSYAAPPRSNNNGRK
jgi:hypothetical protein